MTKIIKKCKLVLVSALLLTLSNSCTSYLEVEPLTKISPELLLSDEAGLKMIIANLYNGIPIEDHCYIPNAGGFNRHNWEDANNQMHTPSNFTDESISGGGIGSVAPGGYNMWNSATDAGRINAWDRNRQISMFVKSIEQARDNGAISEATYNRLWSEANFARAYLYFALAKRFGGVPIIDWLQDDDYVNGDAEPLKIPRSTELDTWKFVLACCDKAILYLPEPKDFASSDGNPMWRASKWAAYALKSRAALYAASIAKYGDRVSFPPGEAVSQNLVGINASEANYFYNECITASKEIIDKGGYSLYMPNPANPQVAAVNYQNLFMNAADCKDEVIFGKTYVNGEMYGRQGHMYDQHNSPYQVASGFHKGGRFSVALDIVDVYEDYTDDGTGKSSPIVTRTDGNETSHFNTNTPDAAAVTSIPFKKYDNPYDAFKNKDARLLASVIVPGSEYKNVPIVMQGALIRKNGGYFIYSRESEEGLDGKTYYVFGAAGRTQYSAFDGPMENTDDANYSITGFSIRKYMGEDKSFGGGYGASTTPYIDFRLAEIYLNYAEAVVESGSGDATAAAGYINAIRKRAAHTDQIPLTLENVLKERRVEMAFENHRVWDLWRRREYHTLFTNYRRKALVQAIDLREAEPKYVFLRMEQFNDIRSGGRTFQIVDYYQNIPAVSVSGLINNPGR